MTESRNADAARRIQVLGTLLCAAFALILAGCGGSPTGPGGDEPSYVNTTPGFGIKYHVTDTDGDRTADVWAVYQAVPLQVSTDYEYMATLTEAGPESNDYRNSTLGGRIKDVGGVECFVYQTGMGVGNQAHFYRDFPVPVEPVAGQVIEDEWMGTSTVSVAGSVSVAGTPFANCIRIDRVADVAGEDYTNGTGYAVLAPGIGIVKIEFTRAESGESYANTTVTYEYVEHTTFEPNSISGTVTTDGATPAENAYVQIASGVLDPASHADATGAFTLAGIYGPDVRLFVGYNGNDEHEQWLDFDYPEEGYPKEYVLNDVTGDVTGLQINLSSSEIGGEPDPFTYADEFGGRGGGGGLFNGPTDVAIDSAGNIYVTDALNYRVQKLTSAGVFDSFITTQGYDEGETELPVALAIDSSDNLYIADRTHGIIIFDSAGTFVREWDGDGTAGGRLDRPIGIDVSADGSAIYVAERDADRVRKFDATGTQLASWGGTGSGNGQFSTPSGLALDSSGNVYVVDLGNNRIQKFDSDGTFVDAWTFTDSGNLSWPMLYDILINESDLYVSDVNGREIDHFNLTGVDQGTITLSQGSGNGEFADPQGLAMTSDGKLVVVDAGNSRVQTIQTTGTYVSQFGSFGGDDPGYFNMPMGIAYAPARNSLYVTEARNNRVQELGLDGTPINDWGTQGYANGEFEYPQGIAVDADGNVYVADYNCLQKFSAGGTFTWRDEESEIAVSVDEDGNLYTFGDGEPVIRKLSASMILLGSWGGLGSGAGQFTQPGGLLWLDGHIYAVDEAGATKKIIKFTDAGTYVTEWEIGESSSSGTPPLYSLIAIEGGTQILVANKRRDTLEVYTPAGELVQEFGVSGDGPGEFYGPTGLALDADGNLYVVDSENNRVQVLSP